MMMDDEMEQTAPKASMRAKLLEQLIEMLQGLDDAPADGAVKAEVEIEPEDKKEML